MLARQFHEKTQNSTTIFKQNEYGLAAIHELEAAIRDIRQAVANEDPEAFEALMRRGQTYLETRTDRIVRP